MIPADAISTDASAKGKNSFNSKAFAAGSASSGSSKFAILLSHGTVSYTHLTLPTKA